MVFFLGGGGFLWVVSLFGTQSRVDETKRERGIAHYVIPWTQGLSGLLSCLHLSVSPCICFIYNVEAF